MTALEGIRFYNEYLLCRCRDWILTEPDIVFCSDKEENGMDENANQDVAACSSNNATSSRVRCENCEQLIMAPMDMENNPDTIDHLNGNGLVRMDMSKIIDSTGLPTYDAALKLESCGYVWF